MTVQTNAPVEQPAGSLVTYQRDPSTVGASVARYAEEIGHCMSLAEQIVDTPIVPAAYWPSVAIEVGGEAKVLKAWEWDPRRKHPRESAEDYAGRRQVAIATTGGVIHVGITLGHESYYQSISGIYFVGGRPALMSEEMRSAVLRAGHYFRVIERADDRATVEVLRRGERGEPRRYTFTMDDAIRAGYVPGVGPNAGTNKWGKQKSGGNEKYITDPATMLLSRVTTVACKVEFPDVIRGLAPDERLDDPVDITATATAVHVSAADITGQPAAIAAPSDLLAQAAGRKFAEQVERGEVEHKGDPSLAAHVEAAREAAAPTATEVPAGQIGEDQWRAINAAFVKLGVTGPGQSGKRLAVLSYLAERTIAKGSDLTANEAATALDALTAVGAKQMVADVLTQPEAAPQDEPTAERVADDQNEADNLRAAAQAEQDLEPPADDPWANAGSSQ